MDFLLDNWYLLVGGAACGLLVSHSILKWYNLPTKEQIKNIKEWLKYAVMEAEKQLGGGTGQAKLRLVYDMAIAKFKWLSFVSFETFSTWVDEALSWLNTQLEDNESIKNYVQG